MISETLLPWYLRELNKLKEELSLYKNESDLWLLKGDGSTSLTTSIKNSPGTLAVHLIGNLKHFIGAQLGHTGYIRNRDKEFAERNIPREKMLAEIDEVISIMQKVLPTVTDEKFNSEFPIPFLEKTRSTGEILFILYGHLNYHLGQINYHRRLL